MTLLEVRNITVDFPQHQSFTDALLRKPAFTLRAVDGVNLTVDRDTGAMTLSNNGGGAATILGYSITSAAGTLDPAAWTSIAGNYDKDAPAPGTGSVDPDDNWTQFTNPASQNNLSEGELDAEGAGNGATITGSQQIDLGNGWVQYPTEDVRIELLMDDGSKNTVGATFVGNGGKPFWAGDFNFDDLVDDDDYVILRDGLHTDLSALSATESYSFGDMNGDSANNYTDTLLFRAAYDEFNGLGAFDAMVAAVPEPTSLALLGLGGAALLFLRRGRLFHRGLLGLAMFSGLFLFCLVSSAGAASLLFDVNDDDAGSPTQAGWIAADATGINNVTFTAVGLNAAGNAVVIDDRDRTGNGGGAEADMWRDFIFANGSNVDGTSGLDVTVSGLLANAPYNVTIWAYDFFSSADSDAPVPTGRRPTWTGSNGGSSAVLEFDGNNDSNGDPPPTNLSDFRVGVTAVTDGSGTLTLEGRAGPDPQFQHNVFINGLELNPVPEPSTFVLLCTCLAGLIGLRRWCR